MTFDELLRYFGVGEEPLIFGVCETGKPRGRSLSPQTARELEQAHPGSTCTLTTKAGQDRQYRREKIGGIATEKSGKQAGCFRLAYWEG